MLNNNIIINALIVKPVSQVDNGMSYNSETFLINYVLKYINYTFYSEIS